VPVRIKNLTDAEVLEAQLIENLQRRDVHPKPRSQKIAHDPKAKAQEERQRREIAIANTTGIRTLAAIAEAVPVRLMKRDLLFVAERLASLLDESRLSIVARRYGIKKAKDTDSLGKLFTAYLRRAEESVLGSVLIETTILYMSTRHNPAQVLNEAAAAYKVDIRQIPGIGPIVATAIVAAIGNGAAFRKGRDFAAWLGVVPRQYSTGGKAKLLGISKRGNVYVPPPGRHALAYVPSP
jgi:hypothetical protein